MSDGKKIELLVSAIMNENDKERPQNEWAIIDIVKQCSAGIQKQSNCA